MRNTLLAGAAVLVAITAAWWTWPARAATAPASPPSVAPSVAPAGAPATSGASDALASAAPSTTAASSAERAPEREDGASAPAIARAPLHARLVDRSTREPLPEFALELTDSRAAVEMVVSDRAGRVRTAGALAIGTVHAALLDHPLASAAGAPRIDVEHASSDEQELALAVGPTFRLDLRSPDPIDASELRLALQPIDPALQRAGWTAAARAREAALPWVRFQEPGEPLASSGPPWELHVAHAASRRAARARIASIVGVREDPVVLELVAAGRIEGRVLRADGAPVAGQRVELYRNDGSRYEIFAWIADSAADGAYAFDGLEPARHMLAIDLGTTDRVTIEREVRGGETTVQDIVAERPPGAGALRGRLVGAPRTCVARYPLTLTADTPLGTPGLALQTSVEWHPEAAEYHGTFELLDVPAGEYVLKLWTPEHEPWVANVLRVRPPDDTLEFRYDASGELASIAFVAVDASTGAPVPSLWHFFELTGVDGAPRVDTGGPIPCGDPVATNVDLARELRWIAGAPGYQPAHGTSGAFERPATPGDPWIARVELRPGFGMELVVQTHADRSRDRDSVAAARVVLDGVLGGVTDASGRVWLASPHEPQRIEVESEGWQVLSGPIDGETGRLRGFALHGVVILRRL